MVLPLFLNGLTGSGTVRPALQAGAVAAAAIAGYVTFMSLTPKSEATSTMPAAELPLWAGYIERPNLEPPTSEPETSASYVVQEPVLTRNASKGSGNISAAILPKAAPGKLVSPPRRPQSIEETASRGTTGVSPAAVVIAASETKSAQRDLFSPVTDRLPATGILLRPIHAFGDAVHNLIKSF